jgi:membrane-bound lytic murein transglycosylase D
MGGRVLWREILSLFQQKAALWALILLPFVPLSAETSVPAETEEVPTLKADDFPRPLRQTPSPLPESLVKGEEPLLPPAIPGLERELTQHYITRYTTRGGLEWLAGIMKNAEPYLAFIRGEIERRKLPPELLYVPVIESGFVSGARSVSGAAGMWQFMRNSIAPFDMRITDWMDERLDFWKSTMGALGKLEENYRALGDWSLALAAYNMGLGGVNNVIKKAGVRDYWVLSEKNFFKVETSHYIPKLLAVSFILSNPRRFGLQPLWYDDPEWTRVKVGRTVDLGLLASAADVDAALLRNANRELFYTVTPPDANYFLKIRAVDAEKISAALARDDTPLIKYHFYIVKSGDTLSALAQHYGVSVEQIQQSNPGVQPKTLKIGKQLIIPAFKDVGPYEGVKKPASAPLPTGPFDGTHLVKKGETLWAIALAYKVAPEALANANGMGLNDTLSIGRVLKVPAH